MRDTVIFKIHDIDKDSDQLAAAAEMLREGKLVVIPTETVYGLAANALDPNASKAIYAAKGRPSDNPLIVHIAETEDARRLAAALPDKFFELAERFWPGPMTLVLPKSDAVPLETTGGISTVAIRMPSHPVARELIRRCGLPLAAPSANLSGSPSPTCAEHCIDDLFGRVDAIVDAGDCEVGVESTVVTLCESPPKILRPGAVTLAQLREILPDIELDSGVFSSVAPETAPASPGMKYKHYAPKARVILVSGTPERFREFVETRERDCGVLCLAGDDVGLDRRSVIYGKAGDEKSQAHELFGALRKLDSAGMTVVYARISDGSGIGQAVKNRLLRAAAFEQITL